MKDVAGTALAVGDRVAMTVPRYRYLIVGTVAKLTPKGATIIWHDERETRNKIITKQTSRACNQLAKL